MFDTMPVAASLASVMSAPEKVIRSQYLQA
jgi:hypothetical protein